MTKLGERFQRSLLTAALAALSLGTTAAASPADRRPIAASQPKLYLGLGHAGEITAVAWRPDGRTLASGARDNSVIL